MLAAQRRAGLREPIADAEKQWHAEPTCGVVKGCQRSRVACLVFAYVEG
jgi:hypothetical protein